MFRRAYPTSHPKPATEYMAPRCHRTAEGVVLPAGVSPVGRARPDLNPRQRLERPLSLTTRLRERRACVGERTFEAFYGLDQIEA